MTAPRSPLLHESPPRLELLYLAEEEEIEDDLCELAASCEDFVITVVFVVEYRSELNSRRERFDEAFARPLLLLLLL